MTKTGLKANKRTTGSRTRDDRILRPSYAAQQANGPRMLDIAVRALLAITVALGVAGSVDAGEGKWTLRLEPMFMEVYGHDQHVLTIHEIDLDSDDKTAVSLDTDNAITYRGEFQYTRGQWGLGVDYFWFATSQSVVSPTGAADECTVVFEIADQSFTSSDPSQVLYYEVLEDTDINPWTVDFYGMRTLAEKPESDIRLQFGLRVGDFDNDYRAVVGIQDAGGTRLDASSNYGLMMGPLVALAGNVHRGKNSIEGYIGQSVLLGSVELSHMSRQFTGPSSTPSFFAQETFRTEKDVAIPITEFRLNWTYRITKNLSVGVGAHTSAWWDVPVPPGVIPIEDGDEALHENTIVFFGLLGIVELTF